MIITCEGRPTWDDYFSKLCDLVSTRATCPRKNVGAVIVKENHVLAVGYNGSLPGLPHCLDIGCDMENGHCVAGDTVISKFQTGQYNSGHRTIKQLYENWTDPQKRGAVKRMKIRSVNQQGMIVPDFITNIWKNPPAKILEVTTQLGRHIKLTEKQKVLTLFGWIPAEEIVANTTKIALNGVELINDPDWLLYQYSTLGKTQVEIARLLNCKRGIIHRRLNQFSIPRREFRLGGWNRGFQREQSCSYKGQNSSRDAGRSRSRRYALKDHCEICNTTLDLDVHHTDKNPLNDTEDNLLTLCSGCHIVAHTPHAKREKVLFDTVKSITQVIDEETFDLTVKENHNYVGNGIVLHNCVAVVHAEANAICNAAARGIALQGATLFSNLYPCWDCFKLIVSAGIAEIAYKEIYGDPTRVEKAWKQLKHICMRQINA